MSKLLARAAFAACVLVNNACTVVIVDDHSGQTRVERRFGMSIVHLPEGATAIARSRTLGMHVGPLGTEIGYVAQSVATLAADCQAIVWVEEEWRNAALREQLQSLQSVCVVNDE